MILVPDGKTPPPFLAYYNAFTADFEIVAMEKHKLSWRSIAPRVSVLKSNKRMTNASIRALTEDSKAMEEHLQLWTIVPKDKLQRNKAGKLDIREVNFSVISKKDGKPIPGSYAKGDGLQEAIDAFVESYEDELEESNPHGQVETIIRAAFAAARSKLEEEAALLEEKGYDEELLDNIHTVKIYPKGTDDAMKSSYINKYYGNASAVL